MSLSNDASPSGRLQRIADLGRFKFALTLVPHRSPARRAPQFEEDPRVRNLVWRLTGWDLALAHHPGSSWLRPAMWVESGEWLIEAGRCRLTITPPWPRRARAMRAERARSLAWRVLGPAEAAVDQASDAALETRRRHQARPR